MLDYAAFPERRQALIFQILQKNGRVICSELTGRLGVSERTIRRDSHELSEDGVYKKVYGDTVTTFPESEDVDMRKSINVVRESNIAQRCARPVKPGNCIFINTDSTNLAMAEALPVELALTMVINLPKIVVVLLKEPLFEVIMLGGAMQRSSGGCVGVSVIARVQDILFNRGFIDDCTMSPKSGLTRFDYADYELRKAVIKQYSEAIVALTAKRIPTVARYVMTESNNIDVIVVEDNISKEYATTFQAHDIRIYTV